MIAASDFNMDNYDWIGFDLDNTIVEYNVESMTKLIYSALTNFLQEKKGLKSKHLEKSLESGLSFIQRGLAMDFERGNVVKLDCKGVVLMASHGTRLLTENEIQEVYGQDAVWPEGKDYLGSIIDQWNGSISQQIRCTLDYFDVVCPLLFARLVDDSDETDNSKNYFSLWEDILDGLNYLYNRDGFVNNTGDYFPALIRSPGSYIKKCPESVVQILESLKKNGKFVFLITGSAIDFANFTATHALGTAWRQLFDLVVCFAKKPAFFVGDRPFLIVEELSEGVAVKLTEEIKVVSQGNWKELKNFVSEKTGNLNPKVVYVGDNLLQDVLAPVKSGCCEAVAICEELGKENLPITGKSEVWGAFDKDIHGNPTIWQHVVEKYSSASFTSVASMAEIYNSNSKVSSHS